MIRTLRAHHQRNVDASTLHIRPPAQPCRKSGDRSPLAGTPPGLRKGEPRRLPAKGGRAPGRAPFPGMGSA